MEARESVLAMLKGTKELSSDLHTLSHELHSSRLEHVGLVSALHAAGARRLVAVSVVAADGAPLVPCGRCRQLLLEAGGPGLLLDGQRGPRELGTLLPEAFTGADLTARRGGEPAAAPGRDADA